VVSGLVTGGSCTGDQSILLENSGIVVVQYIYTLIEEPTRIAAALAAILVSDPSRLFVSYYVFGIGSMAQISIVSELRAIDDVTFYHRFYRPNFNFVH
jgi:hypothetical protein